MFAYMNGGSPASHPRDRFRALLVALARPTLAQGRDLGMRQRVVRTLIDDDQDCVVLRVTLEAPSAGGDEASCHVGYRSCFYREVGTNRDGTPALRFLESQKAFDPLAVYGDTPNPTRL